MQQSPNDLSKMAHRGVKHLYSYVSISTYPQHLHNLWIISIEAIPNVVSE